jgi:hypothetical protein
MAKPLSVTIEAVNPGERTTKGRAVFSDGKSYTFLAASGCLYLYGASRQVRSAARESLVSTALRLAGFAHG